MVKFLKTSVFDSPAQTLVNTVNTVGVMGKGIAKTFKSKFPDMFCEYKSLCDRRMLSVGKLHVWKSPHAWVLNFPTKTTWRQPSKISYVEEGLKRFVETYEYHGVTSASFPPLGCGNGNLDWSEVRPLMVHYLSQVDIPIFIHDMQVPSDFVPEHMGSAVAAETYDAFLDDIRGLLAAPETFETSRLTPFKALMDSDNNISVRISGDRRESIPEELLEFSWTNLRDFALERSVFPNERSRRLAAYALPIIAKLPYVTVRELRTPAITDFPGHILYLHRARTTRSQAIDPGTDAQGCLFH